MNTSGWAPVWASLFSEIVFGAPDAGSPTYMLNRGDVGLLRSLDALSGRSASAAISGGASIAAHAQHLRYGFDLLNRWAAGEAEPWKNADWTIAWKTSTVTDADWAALRAGLRRACETWEQHLREPRELDEMAAHWVLGTIAHTAYHLGAIRQIDRGARGPTAEQEQAAKAVERGAPRVS